ncbi:hypothetical protein FW774_00050 (plasmid) [Pedobacter sp. BS3]|uniref:hypothetical protein n=1 Tax=Pedobacter sp. BS3 TaxID=2567937 RepID=UPI0011EE024B|nr:hypothetical protein [Pedobacter sp. BS3]TZF85510.1 hypothetical protein FW774_00050 [Pedobacter sp. BS3]
MNSKTKIIGLVSAAVIFLVFGCKKTKNLPAVPLPEDPVIEGTEEYPGVPLSDIYSVTVISGNKRTTQVVFKSSCPEYQPGYMNMIDTDQYPLGIFKGRSISWTNFSFSGSVTVEVKVLNKAKVPLSSTVKILPSRYGITPTISGDVISFTLTQPGQCSVEIGSTGYQNGLMIFANPAETNIPTPGSQYKELVNTTAAGVNAVPSTYSGLYFKSGVHNIGVYQVPANIKNIYLEAGAWVYGSIIMDGRPDVHIYGRGVLSSAKLNYRESHCIEAKNQSNNIKLEGIVIADPKYFSVRLIGTNNTVSWVKVIGSWTYNCDGIAAYAGSTVSNCFIWANDDNIKVYRNNITFKDIVCWQLNNGGLIQLSWGNGNASNVTIQRVDILHAEWNNQEVNRGVLSCVGDKFAEGGMYGLQQNFLIEDLVTETPVPLIFRVSPNAASPNEIHGMTFKNWKIDMDMSKGFSSYLQCSDPSKPFDGLVFDNVILNGTKLTANNWLTLGKFQISNVTTPTFK